MNYFPSNNEEAIAFEWLKLQDNSGLSPLELFQKYEKAKDEIFNRPKKNDQDK